MEAPDSLVKAGKVCALGASEMYAYQLHNMEIVAELNGWIPFTSMQFTKICLLRRRAGVAASMPPLRPGDNPLQPTLIWAPGTSRMAFKFRAVEDG